MIADPSQHGFWYNNWGNSASLLGLFVSIAGLIFTILAFRAAVSAKEAAEQVRTAARFWSHSDEVRRGELLSRELASALANGSLVAAFLRIRDLSDLLRILVELWTEDEGIEAKTSLSDCRDDAEQVQKILRKISSNPEQGTAQDTDTCIEFVDKIYGKLLTVRATLDKRRL